MENKEVTALVETETVTNLVYLDLCKPFDTVLHIIFVSKIETRI